MPRKKTAKRAGGVSVAQAESQYKQSLLAKRDELQGQLADIEEKLGALGGTAAAPAATRKKRGRKKTSKKRATTRKTTKKRGRKKMTKKTRGRKKVGKKTGKKRGRPAGRGRSGSMPTAVVSALKGNHLTVDELISKVGHLTSSSNKRAIVSQAINTLMKRGEIKRVSRGVYTAA